MSIQQQQQRRHNYKSIFFVSIRTAETKTTTTYKANY